MGPCRAQVGGPKLGPSQKFGTQKNQKNKILKIKIRSAQNVGKVFLMPEKRIRAPVGALPAHFLRGPEKSQKNQNFAYFPWWANGPYSPGLGSLTMLPRQMILLAEPLEPQTG